MFFGLQLRSSVELPGFPSNAVVTGRPSATTALLVNRSDRDTVRNAFSGPANPPATSTAALDDAPWIIERGIAGDLRMTYGDRADFHLDPAGTVLSCAPADPDEPRWQRAVMDSGLVAAALHRGHEALHAGAVVIDGQAVAIAGPSGAGKTTLLSALVARGHPLLTDDVLVVTSEADCVLAHPGPGLMNVPASVDAAALGNVLAVLDDEAWVEVASVATQAVPLRGIFVLDRREGASQSIEDSDDPQVLLSMALGSGSSPQRQLARLELLSAVAGAVPIRRLSAGLDASPSDLANMIEC